MALASDFYFLFFFLLSPMYLACCFWDILLVEMQLYIDTYFHASIFKVLSFLLSEFPLNKIIASQT